jgi:hypothetical protein
MSASRFKYLFKGTPVAALQQPENQNSITMLLL